MGVRGHGEGGWQMTDWRTAPDRECIRGYYEEHDETALRTFLERTGPLVLASLRRFAWSRQGWNGPRTSGIEPEDALQHALAQLLARKYPLDGPMSPQSWLFAVGRNYMIDPWRPRRLSLRLFELWQGPRPGYETESEGDWLAEQLSRSSISTVGQSALGPEEHVLEEEAEIERERYLDVFRQERDRWLALNPIYVPVIELIGMGFGRPEIGTILGDEALDILIDVIRTEHLVTGEPEPAMTENMRAHFPAARAGELLYDMALRCLASHRELSTVPAGAERSPRDHCLSMMPPRRQRAIKLSDNGFTGSEIGILDGSTERAGQLLINRARKQLSELLGDSSELLSAEAGQEAGHAHGD